MTQELTTAPVDAAVDYIARGWVIFPLWPLERTDPPRCSCWKAECRAPGKHPMPRRWNWDGITEALDQDAAAFARKVWGPPKSQKDVDGRRCGIGLDLGASELVAIDLDSPAAVDRWFDGPFGMLRTAVARTGRGMHVYFRQDIDAPLIRSVPISSMSRVHKTVGTEIKGCGGFTVLPPTRHVNGRIYEWLETVPPVAVPDELRDWIFEAGGRGAAVRRRKIGDRAGDGSQIRNRPGGPFTSPGRWGWGVRLQLELDRLSEMVEHDGRNTQAWHTACWLFGAVAEQVIDETYALELYVAACAACGLTKNDEHHGPWRSARSTMSIAEGTKA